MLVRELCIRERVVGMCLSVSGVRERMFACVRAARARVRMACLLARATALIVRAAVLIPPCTAPLIVPPSLAPLPPYSLCAHSCVSQHTKTLKIKTTHILRTFTQSTNNAMENACMHAGLC